MGVFRQMRERNRGLERSEIDLDRPLVFGVGIRLVDLRRLCPVFFQVVQAELVDREDAVLRTRLDRHVRNREAVVH